MVKKLWVFLNCHKCPPVNRASQVIFLDLELGGTVSRSCNWQLALFTTERQRVLGRGGGIFRKPSLRTGQCKLKAIS